MRRALLVTTALSAALLCAGQAVAQNRPATVPGQSGPAWNALTNTQREALAPLAGLWATMSADRKRKWLDIAEKYPRLSADGKARLHSRMAEFARLTPQQRETARENFRRAYELPLESRESAVQQFQSLPPDKKKELSERSKRKDAAKGQEKK